MLNFISFGSGSSGNCYYLYTQKYGILIDCGIGHRMLKKHFSTYGLSVDNIQAILLTHDHADHVKSVGQVSSSLNIPVYATEPTFGGVRRNYAVHKKIDPANEQKIIAGETFSIKDFSVTPFSVPHDSADCVGYEICYSGNVFCLMTDVGHFTDEMKCCISRANYLVIEANYDVEMLKNGKYPQFLKDRIMSGQGHTSNDTCAEMLIDNLTQQIKHVWLCHLSEENNHPELVRVSIQNKLHAANIEVGKDLQLTVLKRTVPTGVFSLSNDDEC